MRRKDREKNKDFALEVVRDCEYGVLVTLNLDNTPNSETIAAILEAEKIANDTSIKRYSDTEEALAELKS